MLSSRSQAKKKIQRCSNNSLGMAAKTPTGARTGAADISLRLSLLAANIWFPAMIHGGALPSTASPLPPPPQSWPGMGSGFVGRGKFSSVSHRLMESYPAGQEQAMFRSWCWLVVGEVEGMRGNAYLCLSVGTLPREQSAAERKRGMRW